MTWSALSPLPWGRWPQSRAPAAAAQFYKGKTLTLIVNYGVGGNIDAEARILARHLPKHVPACPPSSSRTRPAPAACTP